MEEKKKETVKIVTNEVLRGKPYLDIDRVIIDGKTAGSNQNNND